MPWTSSTDWSDGAVRAFCLGFQARGADPFEALAVCYSESGCYAKPPTGNTNPRRAAGINQIEDLGAVDFHGGADAYEALSAEEQIPYVLRYFDSYAGNLRDVAHLYVANFLPAELGKANDPSAVLCGIRAGDPYPKFYANNANAFDPLKKGWIEVGDLTRRALSVAHGARFDELTARCKRALGEPAEESPDVKNVQEALTILGYPLALDGIAGPLTLGAVAKYEAAEGVTGAGVGVTLALALSLAKSLRLRAARAIALADAFSPKEPG